MVRLTVGEWHIRVWRTETKLAAWNNTDLVAWAMTKNAAAAELTAKPVPFLSAPLPTPNELFAEIEAFPRVAAIEILADNGNGFLLYPNWD